MSVQISQAVPQPQYPKQKLGYSGVFVGNRYSVRGCGLYSYSTRTLLVLQRYPRAGPIAQPNDASSKFLEKDDRIDSGGSSTSSNGLKFRGEFVQKRF